MDRTPSGAASRLSFLSRVGVDPVQFRALFEAGLKLDFRSPSAMQARPQSGWKRFGSLAVMYAMLGIALGMMALFVPDVFLSGSLALSAVMFLVGSSVLIEFAVVVISPLDYEVLGYQPVSSTTYFAVRLANVLFYTSALTTIVGILPMAAYFFARGFDPVLGAAAIAAFYAASITTTVAMIVAYVGIAQLVHPAKLQRVLTYLQLLLSFAIYGGYFMLPRMFEPAALRTWTVRKSAWMLLYPPTWFASYLDLAIGRWTAMEIVPALVGVATAALLGYLTAARLSLRYSEVLSVQSSKSEGPQAPGRALLKLGRTGERRAIALLLRAQFKHDQRFRFTVLSLVPLTLFYLMLGTREGGFRDPFVHAGWSGDSMLLYFAMLMFPMMLLTGVSRTDAYRAAWVFYVTPARRSDLVLALKDLAMVYMLVPYCLGLGLVLAWYYGNILHAYLHLAVQLMFVNLVLLLGIALQHDLPFSRPPMQKGQATGAFFFVLLVASIAQAAMTGLLSRFVYRQPVLLALVVAGFLAGGIAGQRALRRHLDRHVGEMEFAA